MSSTNTIEDILFAGSIFGNIDNCRYTRSMVQYISKSMVELLEINTMTFYEYIKNIPEVLHRIYKNFGSKGNFSYIKNVDNENTLKFEASLKALIMTHTRADMSCWMKFKMKLFNPVRWMFELCSFASTYWILYMLGFNKTSFEYCIAFYIMDVLYVLNSYVVIMTTQSSFGSMKIRQMVKWYLRARLPIVLAAVFPFEIIVLIGNVVDNKWINCFRLNRVLRTVNFLLFMMEKFKSLKVHIWRINAICFIAEITFFVHACGCILYYLACPNGECSKTSWVIVTGENYYCTNHYLCSIYYATSIFTQTGFSTVNPQSVEDRVTCVVIALIGRILLFITIGQVFISMKYFTLTRLIFNKKFAQFKHFLEFTTMTQALQQKICTYLNNLWTYQQGNQVPVLMNQMPSYMNIVFKCLIYGQNMFNSNLFDGCHPDFIRQVNGFARHELYFAGDVICFEGEINATMYFVQNGVVEVLDPHSSPHVETVIDELWRNDTFGVVQGLLQCKPHLYTFRAKEVTTILSLRRTEWEHLLIFFPASAHAIFDKFVIGPEHPSNRAM